MLLQTKNDAILLGFTQKQHLVEFAKQHTELYESLCDIYAKGLKETKREFKEIMKDFDYVTFMVQFNKKRIEELQILKTQKALKLNLNNQASGQMSVTPTQMSATSEDTLNNNVSQKRVFTEVDVFLNDQQNIITSLENTIVFIQQQANKITDLENALDNLSFQTIEKILKE
jgi:hypothetical protein